MQVTAEGVAPGRLDFLGGVADYSGSLVLQMPLQATTRVLISLREDALIEVESPHEGRFQMPLVEPNDFQNIPVWARYVLGCLHLFGEAMGYRPEHGLRFEIKSDVPVAMGVSSSAALEVATLRALENLTGKKFSGTDLAKLAQRAENEIVGAPCGLMDQLASAHGQHNALLPIVCRPDILREPIPLPDGVLVVGWPSGVKHVLADSPYSIARCAAFMGKKILETHFVRELKFLTEIAPSMARGLDENTLPAAMRGDEFLEIYGGVDDPLSVIQSDKTYPVRAATLFPIEENFRCEVAALLLRNISMGNRTSALRSVGELMLQSHEGYTSIGLGSQETDAMVKVIGELGMENGFYGARVSGGGSGGTVVVLLEKESLSRLPAEVVLF